VRPGASRLATACAANDDGNFQWLCDVVTHELGHLFGHADEGQADLRSVEYPLLEPGTPTSIHAFRLCVKRWAEVECFTSRKS
jgi:hypothetical protein